MLKLLQTIRHSRVPTFHQFTMAKDADDEWWSRPSSEHQPQVPAYTSTSPFPMFSTGIWRTTVVALFQGMSSWRPRGCRAPPSFIWHPPSFHTSTGGACASAIPLSVVFPLSALFRTTSRSVVCLFGLSVSLCFAQAVLAQSRALACARTPCWKGS